MADYPPLLSLSDEIAYRRFFEEKYCSSPIISFDGISVRFRKHQFDHCCFESSNKDGKKDAFSHLRAQRLHWIEIALKDQSADRFAGWDKNSKRHDHTRRVTLVCQDYVVIIGIQSANKANFITCYVADTGRTLALIKASPRWMP